MPQLKDGDLANAPLQWDTHAAWYAITSDHATYGIRSAATRAALQPTIHGWLGTDYLTATHGMATIVGWINRARQYKVLLRTNNGTLLSTTMESVVDQKTAGMGIMSLLDLVQAWRDNGRIDNTPLNIAHSILAKLGCTGYPAPGNYDAYMAKYDLKTEHPGNTVCFDRRCIVCTEIRREVDTNGGQQDCGPAIVQAWRDNGRTGPMRQEESYA